MKNILVQKMFLPAYALIALMIAGGNPISAVTQDSEDRMIDRAQRAVRQQIIRQEGGRNLTVSFNTDAQTDSRSRTGVRVRGTGSFSRSNDSRDANSRDDDQRYNNSRNRGGRSRDFSYEATVSNRGFGTVSGVRYDLSDSPGDHRDDNSRDNDRDDNRRDSNDRDPNRRDNNDRNDNLREGNRPDGRVSYSGPIMNRHSNKALDVTERSNQDGANIQQWSYSDQPNQNWDVIDIGNGEAAVISRQSGKALTVQGGRDQNGANIIQQSWRARPQQRWRLEQTGSDYYRIISVDNGKCLDVTREGKQDGANIQLWECANQANQQWRLRR